MLTHKDEEGSEFLISFMRIGLLGVEMNYLTDEK